MLKTCVPTFMHSLHSRTHTVVHRHPHTHRTAATRSFTSRRSRSQMLTAMPTPISRLASMTLNKSRGTRVGSSLLTGHAARALPSGSAAPSAYSRSACVLVASTMVEMSLGNVLPLCCMVCQTQQVCRCCCRKFQKRAVLYDGCVVVVGEALGRSRPIRRVCRWFQRCPQEASGRSRPHAAAAPRRA